MRFIEAGQQGLVLQTTINDPLYLALKAVVAQKAFDGRMDQLFNEVCSAAENPRVLPKSPSALSKVITRHRQAYGKAGLCISAAEHKREGSFIRIELMYEEPESVTPTGIPI